MDRFTVPASYQQADAATQRLRQAAAQVLPQHRLDGLEIAVAEALNNIVRHAYGEDESRVTGVKFMVTPELVNIVLRDNGIAAPRTIFASGAAPSRQDDDEDLLSESGRGIGLIRACVDRLSYRTGRAGNVLQLTFMRNR